MLVLEELEPEAHGLDHSEATSIPAASAIRFAVANVGMLRPVMMAQSVVLETCAASAIAFGPIPCACIASVNLSVLNMCER